MGRAGSGQDLFKRGHLEVLVGLKQKGGGGKKELLESSEAGRKSG